MRRTLLGIVSLLFLAASGTIYFQGVTDDNIFLLSVCQRVGIVLGAMWLAYDQVLKLSRKSPSWMLGCIAACLLVIVVRPKAIFIVAPLLALVMVLQFFGWLFKPLPNPRKSASAARKQRPDQNVRDDATRS